MDPRIARGAAKQASNGDSMFIDSNSFEPPPSTLAAQLVNNLSNARKRPLQDSEDNFALLTSEVSNFDKNRDDHTTSEEITEHNHRTVYVITRACLDPAHSGESDPFANKEKVLEVAGQGLDVLLGAIKETPVILVKIAELNGLVRTGRGIPLWVWLWPRLLRLLGKEGCERLWQKIREFFETAFELARKSQVELWGLEQQFSSYLRHCVDAALHHIDAISTITLPLPTIEDEIFLLGNPDFIQDGCTYTLNDGPDSFHHAYQLLTLVVEIFSSSLMEDPSNNHGSFRGYVPWIFDTFLELRTVAVRYAMYKTEQEEIDSCSKSLSAVHKLLISLGPHLSDAAQRKGYRALALLCADFVGQPKPFSDTLDSYKFSSVLLDLASACEASGSVSQTVISQLLPILDKTMSTETLPGKTDEKLGQVDVQVSTSITV